MHLVGFEPAILATERSQTNALDRAATGIVTDNIKQQMFSHRPTNSSTWVKSTNVTVSGRSDNMSQIDKAVKKMSVLN